MSELLIMFREVLEASLIIGILYTFLVQSKKPDLIKQLWNGVFTAIGVSIICSFLFQMLAGGFEGNAAKIFEGIVMIVAAFVLATMIIWMSKNINIKAQLEKDANNAMKSTNAPLAIFILAFVAVFREGVEIILFLYSIALKDGLSILPSLLGTFLGLVCGYLIFIKGRSLPLKTFFNITSTFLILVCAGMMTYGVHELESGGVIPYFTGTVDAEQYPMKATRMSGDVKNFSKKWDKGEVFTDINKNDKWDEGEFFIDNPAYTQKKAHKWASRLWDVNPPKNKNGTYPMFHDKGSIGGLLKGFLGYNGDPSLIELITWLLTISLMGFLWKTNSSKAS